MDSNFFDMPFRTPSANSEFLCKDAEIAVADNVKLIAAGEETALLPSALSSGPPIPDIDFALVRTTLSGWNPTADNYPVKTLVASNPSMEYWTPLAGSLLAQFKSEAELQNLFVAPFYVMAAWKTKEGNYLSASTPVMMIPNSSVPLVATDSDILREEVTFKIAAAVCNLYFRMRAPEILRDWVGLISSLEILVSEPLQRYDTYTTLLPEKHTTTLSYCRSLDLNTGIIADRRICTETLNLAWRANTKGVASEETETGFETLKFRSFGTIPLSEVDLADNWSSTTGRGSLVKLTNGLDKSIDYRNILSGNKSKSSTAIIEGEGKEIKVITRAIKVKESSKLKKVRRIHIRGEFQDARLNFTVYGSRDLQTWWPLAKKQGGTVLGLPSSYFSFYKLEITGILPKNNNIQGISCYKI